MATQPLITAKLLRVLSPSLQPAVAENYAPLLEQAAREFEINTPARVAAWLAQLAHESGGFRYLREIWGPTAQQQRYEPPGALAEQLGNTEPGDGFKFRGRGWIQLTGRANYIAAGKDLGLDLVGNPALAGAPSIAARVAGWFWKTHRLNRLADLNTLPAFRQITRRINGGANGATERARLWQLAKDALA